MIHPSAVIGEEAEIGPDSKVWHFCHVMSNAQIGTGCVLGQNVMVAANVVIGNGTKIQNNVSVFEGVTLEENVFCGPSAVFTNVLTPRAFVNRRDDFLPTLVRRGATIGANATIVCGITIGQYAMVGAGSVVTRDVPDYALMTGVPARRIGWVSRTGDRLGNELICPRTGERYSEVSGVLELMVGDDSDAVVSEVSQE